MNDPESRMFTLSEAESTRAEIESSLIEAMESRRRMVDLEATLLAQTERIVRMGGVSIPYEKAAATRLERDRVAASLQDAVDRIHSTGCIVKDLEVGLLDFPARMDNQNVYLCWRLGEPSVQFWHEIDAGFVGRRPLEELVA